MGRAGFLFVVGILTILVFAVGGGMSIGYWIGGFLFLVAIVLLALGKSSDASLK